MKTIWLLQVGILSSTSTSIHSPYRQNWVSQDRTHFKTGQSVTIYHRMRKLHLANTYFVFSNIYFLSCWRVKWEDWLKMSHLSLCLSMQLICIHAGCFRPSTTSASTCRLWLGVQRDCWSLPNIFVQICTGMMQLVHRCQTIIMLYMTFKLWLVWLICKYEAIQPAFDISTAQRLRREGR